MALIFSKNSDRVLRIVPGAVGAAAAAALAIGGYLSRPEVIETGYQPEQPVPYSHKLHAGNLGMDCFYCHSTVEKSAYAAIPASHTCMNCH